MTNRFSFGRTSRIDNSHTVQVLYANDSLSPIFSVLSAVRDVHCSLVRFMKRYLYLLLITRYAARRYKREQLNLYYIRGINGTFLEMPVHLLFTSCDYPEAQPLSSSTSFNRFTFTGAFFFNFLTLSDEKTQMENIDVCSLLYEPRRQSAVDQKPVLPHFTA